MKTVVLFGDSITDMGRWRDADTHAFSYGVGYSLFLKEKIERNNLSIKLLNRGCSGDSTTNLLERINEDVIKNKPDIVTILIGTNDVWHQFEGDETHSGNTIEQFEKNYRKIIKIIKTKLPKTKILMFGSFFLPINEPDKKEFWTHMRKIYSYVDELRNQNKQLIKKVHALNRKFKKNQNDLSILEPRAAVFKEIYTNLDKIAKLQKPVLGRNEYQIAKLRKNISLIENEIKKFENFKLDKSNKEKEKVNIINKSISQRKEHLKNLKKELDYFSNHDTQLTKLRNLTAFEIEIEINKTAESIDLVRYLFRKPAALSGGQRQRVALGRAIVRKPKVFLMDEPLSNLDAKLRVQTRSEITKIHEKVGATTIYVTHDQTEAMTMADRIVIMKDGWIQQIGTPDEVYNDPANQFVAGFIGSPAMNFIECVYSKGKLSVVYKAPTEENFLSANLKKQDFTITLPKDIQRKFKGYEGKHVVLGVRPENVHLSSDKTNHKPGEKFKLNCDFAELLGYELILYTFINGQKIILKTDAKNKVKTNDSITVCFDNSKLYFFDKETTKRIK